MQRMSAVVIHAKEKQKQKWGMERMGCKGATKSCVEIYGEPCNILICKLVYHGSKLIG